MYVDISLSSAILAPFNTYANACYLLIVEKTFNSFAKSTPYDNAVFSSRIVLAQEHEGYRRNDAFPALVQGRTRAAY